MSVYVCNTRGYVHDVDAQGVAWSALPAAWVCPLRARLDIAKSANRLTNCLNVCTEELESFARLTGNDDVHNLAASDLRTVNSEISGHTLIKHA